jgi:hypothetical protein
LARTTVFAPVECAAVVHCIDSPDDVEFGGMQEKILILRDDRDNSIFFWRQARRAGRTDNDAFVLFSSNR